MADREVPVASPVDAFLGHFETPVSESASIHHDHYVHQDASSDAPAGAATGVGVWTRWRGALRHFMFEKKPSQYSSISPRRPDGTRTKIFFFNGSGKGR